MTKMKTCRILSTYGTGKLEIDSLNEALKKRAVKKDQRKRELIQNAVRTLSKAVGDNKLPA